MREFHCFVNLDNMPGDTVTEMLSGIAAAVAELPPEVTVTSAILDKEGNKVGSWRMGARRKYAKKGAK